MYCIMEETGTIFFQENGKWHIALDVLKKKRKYKLKVLDYSDWSIEVISLGSLISALKDKSLCISDFINLLEAKNYYMVGDSYIFNDLTRVPSQFEAKGMIFHLGNNFVNIGLSGDRWFSLGCNLRSFGVYVNYKHIDDCNLSGMDIMNLVPCSGGYKFDIGYNGISVYMYPKYFMVKIDTCRREFQYRHKAELARESMLQW